MGTKPVIYIPYAHQVKLLMRMVHNKLDLSNVMAYEDIMVGLLAETRSFIGHNVKSFGVTDPEKNMPLKEQFLETMKANINWKQAMKLDSNLKTCPFDLCLKLNNTNTGKTEYLPVMLINIDILLIYKHGLHFSTLPVYKHYSIDDCKMVFVHRSDKQKKNLVVKFPMKEVFVSDSTLQGASSETSYSINAYVDSQYIHSLIQTLQHMNAKVM